MKNITKKHIVLSIFVSILVILLIPIVRAEVLGPGETLLKVVEWIIIVFKFQWLTQLGEQSVIAFVRFLIFVFIARVLYLTITTAGQGRIDNRTAGISSIILSLIGAVGIPDTLIKTVVSLYSTLAIMFMLGFIVYIFILAHRRFPGVSMLNRIILVAIYVISSILMAVLAVNITAG
ncbi:hypothetical protein HOC35_00645 [Candidatus Woesearchaeota archaeon]|jgi:hypothetical protein|nr:hypothetical protein [Candidatus Woesearchaeota archaeon]